MPTAGSTRGRLVENAPVMDQVWTLAPGESFARRRIIDARLARTLRHHGATELATVNTRDFAVYSFSTDAGLCGHVGPTGVGKCRWSAQSTASWITVLTSMPRNGEDCVVFRVAANGSATPRTASITVGNRTLYIGQAGI